jgi:hypothetical protein
MTPSRQKIHVLVVVAAIALIQACTPTRPPVDELDAASRAFGAARAADAATLAPAEYRAAGQHLDQATAAEARQDYDAAAQFARESAADSELASAKARVGKARETADKLKQDNANIERDLSEHPSAEAQP